ncbi:MAG: hypothetical protein WA162_01020 [Thermodesulfobacteriota bacterium]
MRRTREVLFIVCVAVSVAAGLAAAETFDALRKRIKQSHPSEQFIVGIADVETSGSAYKDKRRVEILARLEIAKQIKVKIASESTDVMCGGAEVSEKDDRSECRNRFAQIVTETVEETLKGSNIIEQGSLGEGGRYYAVAVLSKSEALSRAGEGLKGSVEKAKEYIDKAKASEGNDAKENADKARQEIIKGKIYDLEMSAVDETRKRAGEVFIELDKEMNSVNQGAESR